MVTRLPPVFRHSGRPNRPDARGVTLFEMLIVIVVIGILTSIAMTRLDWTRYRADAAARGTMAELSTAQRIAVSIQTNVIVTIVDSLRMQIVEDANDNGSADAGERVRTVPLDNNFYYGKANAPNIPSPDTPTTLSTITFHRDGSANANGTVYLHGPGSDPNCKHCRAISIARATGRAVWYSYSSGSWKRAN